MGKSFAEVHPELVGEWSHKNGLMRPEDISYGSNKLCWWHGSCGHDWQASPKSRSSGEKCPYCAGMRVLEGFNDLAFIKPELVAEWSAENEPLTPSAVNASSHRKVKWKGLCGHEWSAEIRARVRGTGCPYCSNTKIMPGFNDLATVHPRIAKEWSPRNFPLTPDQAPAGANRMAWWRCAKGHEWKTLISTRVGGSKCPYCSGVKLLEGYNDLKTKFPELAKEWSEKNNPLRPENINEKSRQSIWWKCRWCGHEWQAVVSTRVRGGECPVCADRKVVHGINDLTTTDPHIVKEWDYGRNNRGPETYSRNSMGRIWWIGVCGHSWNAKIADRTINGQGCRVCEASFRNVLPQLAVVYYAGKYGLKVKLNDEDAIGIPLETYIPSAGLAIEAPDCRFSKQWLREYEIKRLQCEICGIHLFTITDLEIEKEPLFIKRGGTDIDLLNAVLAAFKESNIFIKADPEIDLAAIRASFFRRQKP